MLKIYIQFFFAIIDSKNCNQNLTFLIYVNQNNFCKWPIGLIYQTPKKSIRDLTVLVLKSVFNLTELLYFKGYAASKNWQ